MASNMARHSKAGEGASHKAAVAQREWQGQPGHDAVVDPRELADGIERADKGGVLGRRCWISDRGRQAVAPAKPIVILQRCSPFREAVEQVEMAGEGRTTRDFEVAAPRKYVNFLNLGRLQLQGPRIAAPRGARGPCFGHRTDDNPGIETGNRGCRGRYRRDHFWGIVGTVSDGRGPVFHSQ